MGISASVNIAITMPLNKTYVIQNDNMWNYIEC